MRFFYYVIPAATPEHWEIRSSLKSPGEIYASRDLAILAARQGCRRQAEELGRRCGVRIESDDGAWLDEALFDEQGKELS
ncbi:MAG: hypothetical protein ABIW30_05970 [Arenimonas sp.]